MRPPGHSESRPVLGRVKYVLYFLGSLDVLVVWELESVLAVAADLPPLPANRLFPGRETAARHATLAAAYKAVLKLAGGFSNALPDYMHTPWAFYKTSVPDSPADTSGITMLYYDMNRDSLQQNNET